MKNIVYLELLRRGYRVNIGKIDEKEIDFVATKQDSKEYYQVAMTALDESVRERELAALGGGMLQKKDKSDFPIDTAGELR